MAWAKYRSRSLTKPSAVIDTGVTLTDLAGFFTELKRRSVYRIALSYAVVGWLLIQVATQVFPFFDIPKWAVRLVILGIVIGFPIALVIAWAFELTPKGIKRDEDAPREAIRSRPRAWLYVAATAAAASLALFFLMRSTVRNAGVPQPGTTEKSVAVLPFANLSGEKDNEYFTDGVQDEILGRLARLADLKVISRTSTQVYKSGAPRITRDTLRIR